MNAEELIRSINNLPEEERAKVIASLLGQKLNAHRRTAFLASVTTAFVLLCALGIFLLSKKPAEAPPVAAKTPIVQTHLASTSTPSSDPIVPPAEAVRAPVLDIPPRDPQASSNLVDLSQYYNGDLQKNWHNSGGRENDNNLRELPRGLQTMAGTQFDVRGVIAVNEGSGSPMFMDIDKGLPQMVEGIRIGQKCKRLHFLHAAYNAAYSNLEEIGHYRLHFVDGGQQVLPIVTGRDLLDWHKSIPPGSPLVVAWEGDNQRSRQRGTKIHLFRTTWENPSPELEIQTLDLVSRRGAPAPFLVAITAE